MGDGSDPNPEKHEKNETARLMLQIYHERSNHLANMLIALNGFILAFIAGLLAFVGSSALSSPKCMNINGQILVEPSSCINPWPILIAINIAIIILIIWRLYSHYIDDDIVNCYKKIILLEDYLFNENLDKRISLRYSVTKSKEKTDIDNIDYGSRGHWAFDSLAFICCVILLFIECLSIRGYSFKTELIPLFFFIVFVVGISFAFVYKHKQKSGEIKNIICGDSVITFILNIFIVIVILLIIWFFLI